MTPNASASLLLLATDFPPAAGGIQTLTGEIYSRLADLVCFALAPAAPVALAAAPGFPLVRSRFAASAGWRGLPYLADAARRLAPHRGPGRLLHCNHLFAAYAAWPLRARLPYLVWIHGEELAKTRYPRFTRRVLAAAAAILTNSAFTARLIRARLPGRCPPIHIIPLGAPPGWLDTPAAPPEAATALSGLRAPRILSFARLSRRDRYKGIDTALSACAELRRRGIAFEYVIAGGGGAGADNDRPYLERLAAALGLHSSVRFLGRVPDAERMALYDQCDVFLLCGREHATPRGLGFEGFGIVFLEANARGKPVVAGAGGAPDAVLDGVTGLLADPESPAAVADALQRLLADPGLRRRLGERGRERVRREYNWDHAAARVRRIHLELVAEL